MKNPAIREIILRLPDSSCHSPIKFLEDIGVAADEVMIDFCKAFVYSLIFFVAFPARLKRLSVEYGYTARASFRKSGVFS